MSRSTRQRLRGRFTELYTERTCLQAQLDTLTTPADEPASDPALLDELPTLSDIITGAPATLIERLLAIFDLSAVYNRDQHQLTIHATITETTPPSHPRPIRRPPRRPQPANIRPPPYRARSRFPLDQANWVIPRTASRLAGPGRVLLPVVRSLLG
jgi:hypothetical protein